MLKNLLRSMVFLCISVSSWVGSETQASHGMGADLTYTCLGGNQYRVSFSFYRDCTGITPSTSYTIPINSTCGNTSVFVSLVAGYPVEVSPLCAAQLPNSTCNFGTLPGVTQYFYEGIVTLPTACVDWVFSFSECCRNPTISTLSNPGSEGLYVQATLNNVAAPCNSSPAFTTTPVPYICAGQTYIYNHGAVDIDGDSLVYTLVNAQNTAGFPVVYSGGFSGTNPMTSVPPVTINSSNGNVTMNPTTPQVAIMAVRVEEYRNGVLIGSTIRDIQITVLSCTNAPPTINPLSGLSGGTQTGPYSVEVCPGQTVSFTIPGLDSDVGQLINWSWNNGIPGGIFTAPSGSSPQNATFSWTPGAGNSGLNSLTVTLEDDACPVLGQAVRAIDILVLEGTSAGPDQAYCTGGGPVQINTVGGTSFTWTTLAGDPGGLSCTNCQNPFASPSVTSTYIVQSNLPALCKNRDTITINVVPTFTLAMGPAQTICQSGSTTLLANPSPAGPYTFVWSPTTALSSSTVSNPTASPTASTTYNVTVTSAAGCRISGSQSVTVSNAVLSVAPTASPVQSCAGAPVTLNANVLSGDCSQYTGANIPFAPVGSLGTSVFLGDDQVSGAVPIGFNFNFFCNTYSDAHISSNGFITFNPLSGPGCCGGQVLPNPFDPNDVIAAGWDDLYPPGAGSITYQTLGLAPNRRFVVTYSGIPFCCGSVPEVSSQIILYETTNVIEIHTTSINNINPGTQGIENATGTAAYFVPGRNGTVWSATNDAYRFTPVLPTPFTVSWQAPLGNTVTTGSPASITPIGTTTYYAVATNGVCSATAPVTVDVSSVNAGLDVVLCPTGQNTTLLATYNGPPPPSSCNVYTVTGIPFAPVAAGGTPVGLFDDQVSGAIPMGFTFTFFCNNYTDAYISSNGFITFNPASGSGCCSGQVIPDALDPNNLIAAAWDDLYPPGAGSITYQTLGVAPNRQFVVSYTGIPYCCGTTPEVTSQIILYETTNVIEIHSASVVNIIPGTQGIENSTGTLAFTSPGRNSSGWTATNDAFRFSPQVSTISYTWAPPTFLSSTTVDNPTATNVTSTVTYTVTVNNGTCVLTDDVTVSICPLVESVQLTALAEGDDVRLNWVSVNEQGLQNYVIERTADGTTWGLLSIEAAHGTTGTFNYRSFDREPLSGTNTYRLRLVDQNGSVSYSNLAEVVFEGKDWVSVTPNPGFGVYAMQIFAAEPGQVSVEVMSADGKLISKQDANTDVSGNLTHTIDIQSFPAGNYLYRVNTPTGKISGRIVKVD